MRGVKSTIFLAIAAIVMVSCEKRPKPEMSLEVESPVVYEPVKFTDISENGVTRDWDFGDGVKHHGETEIHQFAKDGDHVVTLTSYSKSGKRSRSIEKTVTVGLGTTILLTTVNEAGDVVKQAEVEVYRANALETDAPIGKYKTNSEGQVRLKGLHTSSEYKIKARKQIGEIYHSNLDDYNKNFKSSPFDGGSIEYSVILKPVG